MVRDFDMVASNPPDKTSVVQTLQRLLDRLSDPDLTAAEAQELRPHLFRLVESIDADGRTIASGDRKAVRRPRGSRFV
jgi:hypothetical protein